MKLAGIAALVLAASPLAVGCTADPTCDDVDALQQELDKTDVDDPAYNDINNDLARAQADCNT